MKEALPEEKYIEQLDKIIVRDFFPDLPKLRLQMEWEKAVENHDLPKIREISQNLHMKRKAPSSPSSLASAGSVEPQSSNFEETPLPTDLPPSTPSDPSATPSSKKQKTSSTTSSDTSNLRLDSFLHQYTSEDNASFSQIMQVTAEKKKKQLWWMYDKTDQQKLIEASSDRLALSWSTPPNIQLLTYPTLLPEQNIINGAREIDPTATRFIAPPPRPKQEKKKEENTFQMLTDQEFTLGARRRAEASKKVDLDNLLVPGTSKNASESKTINGFEFVADPSSTPSKHDPIITWGEIEGTPILLAPTDTPITIGGGGLAGEGFKVPQTPKRDQICLDLVDKAKARQRQSQTRNNHPTSCPTSSSATPTTNPSALSRDLLLSPRSPAGQRLAELIQSKNRSTVDHQLRASYSPSIRSGGSAVRTPGTTPLTSSSCTTKKAPKTPTNASTATRTNKGNTTPIGVTDNLLNV